LIAETGEMRVTAAGPSFGAGAVIDQQQTKYRALSTRSLQPSPTTPAPGLDCTVGTADANADERPCVAPIPPAHDRAELSCATRRIRIAAGKDWQPDAEFFVREHLNIDGDGTLIGADNGLQC
jgi:hypothetical protein